LERVRVAIEADTMKAIDLTVH
ncbi:MAG: hypothetical protein RLZZ514_1296, partial [Actinomycetota bacterium]